MNVYFSILIFYPHFVWFWVNQFYMFLYIELKIIANHLHLKYSFQNCRYLMTLFHGRILHIILWSSDAIRQYSYGVCKWYRNFLFRVWLICLHKLKMQLSPWGNKSSMQAGRVVLVKSYGLVIINIISFVLCCTYILFQYLVLGSRIQCGDHGVQKH